MQPKRKLKTRPAARRRPRYSSLNPRQKATRERTLNLLSDLRAGKAPYRKTIA